MIKEINTIEAVRLFAYQLVNNENLSFHPDDDFADYTNTTTNKSTYTSENASHLNRHMQKCFAVCEKSGVDIYEIMGESFFRRIRIGKK